MSRARTVKYRRWELAHKSLGFSGLMRRQPRGERAGGAFDPAHRGNPFVILRSETTQDLRPGSCGFTETESD